MKLFNRKKKINQIEYMHSYDDFPRDVEDSFSSIVDKYEFKFHVQGICSVDIENKFCRINLNMDRFDLQGLLFINGEETSFSLSRLASDQNDKKFEKEEFPSSDYGNKESIKRQLEYYANISDKYLETTLKGDFSWFNRMKEEDAYEKQLVGLILGSEIEHTHPISKKFWSGDKSWKTDIENYIRQNNIEINKVSS